MGCRGGSLILSVAIGIVTVNRPEYAERCAKAIVKHCSYDYLYIYNDGSDPLHSGAYKRAFKPIRAAGGVVMDCPDNHGVAYAKNQLLGAALDDGVDWVFLVEDDIIAKSPMAVTGYLDAAKATDFQHLSFAHHGPANVTGPLDRIGDIEFYKHSIGAWCLYSREFLDTVGFFDENFVNAWEHVEHEMRAYSLGLAPHGGPHRFADVAGSAEWLAEIPGSIERSSIRPRADWNVSIRNGLMYWRDNKPDTFNMLFGPDMELHGYAMQMIG